jgi:hypothetical protein
LQVSKKFGVHRLERPWACIGSSALTGEGLYEGLDWTVEAIKAKQGQKESGAGKPGAAPRPELTSQEKEMEALLQWWLEQEDEEDDDFLHKFR